MDIKELSEMSFFAADLIQDAADAIDKKAKAKADPVHNALINKFSELTMEELADGENEFAKSIKDLAILDLEKELKTEQKQIEEEKAKYPGRHYTDYGWKAPLHAFFNPKDKIGIATWATVAGREVDITIARPGSTIEPQNNEIYVGDVIACIRTFQENEKLKNEVSS